MTVVNIDSKGVTFLRNGQEVTLTWGELNFLKSYKKSNKSNN